jgi:hypothetical protein
VTAASVSQEQPDCAGGSSTASTGRPNFDGRRPGCSMRRPESDGRQPDGDKTRRPDCDGDDTGYEVIDDF